MNYQEMLKSNYNEVVNYLKDKYGKAEYNYFLTPTCKSKNRKISRTNEGLVCHHIGEIEIMRLSEPEVAQQYDYTYQLAENLVYCNYIEHLILHILIHRENPNNSKPGMRVISTDINTLYNTGADNTGWRLKCYYVIKDDIKEYAKILKNELNQELYGGKADNDLLCCYILGPMGFAQSEKIKKLLNNI